MCEVVCSQPLILIHGSRATAQGSKQCHTHTGEIGGCHTIIDCGSQEVDDVGVSPDVLQDLQL